MFVRPYKIDQLIQRRNSIALIHKTDVKRMNNKTTTMLKSSTTPLSNLAVTKFIQLNNFNQFDRNYLDSSIGIVYSNIFHYDILPNTTYMSQWKIIIFIPEYAEKNLPSIQGFSTIVQTLVRNSKCFDILCNEKETQALIQQWLEYIVIYINYADVPVNANRILNELNTIIKDVPYITGTKKTIADIALYYVLHSIMKELSLQQKAQYIHVSRWFDNIQQEEKLRRELDLISFNLLHLFV